MCCLIEGTMGGPGTCRSRRTNVVGFGIGSVSERTTIGSRPIIRRPLHIDRLFVRKGTRDDSIYMFLGKVIGLENLMVILEATQQPCSIVLNQLTEKPIQR